MSYGQNPIYQSSGFGHVCSLTSRVDHMNRRSDPYPHGRGPELLTTALRFLKRKPLCCKYESYFCGLDAIDHRGSPATIFGHLCSYLSQTESLRVYPSHLLIKSFSIASTRPTSPVSLTLMTFSSMRERLTEARRGARRCSTSRNNDS